MALISIDDVINLGDFESITKWTLVFSGQPTAYQGPPLQGLNLRCESINMPKVNIPSVDIQIRGHKVKQPGIADYGNQLTLNLFETTDMYVTRAIKAWKELCWQNRTGVARKKSELSCIIQLYRMDNRNNYMYGYEIYGCFLEDYDHGGDLDASTGDAQKPTMTIAFDYFKEMHANQILVGGTSGQGSTTSGGTAPTDFA